LSTTQEIGKQTEQAAKEFLQQHGLTLIEENYLCKLGEIDLIMRDNDQLVFIEVKYRRSCHYGSGYEAVTHKKQKNIINTARYFLALHKLTENISCRFDIVSMSPKKFSTITSKKHNPFNINWIKNAFYYS
jgi:putative endonuclease